MNCENTLTNIKGIGDKIAASFAKLDVYTVGDLVHYYPKTYEKYPELTAISDCVPDSKNAVFGMVKGEPSLRRIRSLSILSFVLIDKTGSMQVTIFNMPYLKNSIKSGKQYVLYGRVVKSGSGIKMEQPSFYSQEEYDELRGRLIPKYPLTKGITNNTITKALNKILKDNIEIDDAIPRGILEECNISDITTAVKEIHFPHSEETLLKARESLVFREFLSFIIQTKSGKSVSRISSEFPMINTSDTVRLIEALPYKLTNAQHKVYEEIVSELTDGFVMNRLIQGDVGSGKTIVAILSLLLTCSNGYQGAMMAPTEVLAMQHYKNICELTKKYNLCFKPVLLTGSLSAKDKRLAQEAIADGTVNVIIGTQALIQDKVNYKNLALVITDEQHRFGVKQREAFAEKGKMPHTIVMSATPIPRTLAIILFGDMNVSVIDEYPSTHIPVKTCVMPSAKRGSAINFILKEVEKGHQAYIICPMALEGEDDDIQDVITYTDKLREHLPENVRCEYLHGKLKNEEKNRIMDGFSKKNIDILVSTTVVEVGVDVPNATVIMIENSERFGLASLHQLRGRVGRGADTSYCIYLQEGESDKASKRLNILNESHDGFYIANQDMKLRGPGDIFGIRQSGVMEFKLGDIYQDSELLIMASGIYEKLEKEQNGETLKEILDNLIKSGYKVIDYKSM